MQLRCFLKLLLKSLRFLNMNLVRHVTYKLSVFSHNRNLEETQVLKKMEAWLTMLRRPEQF